MTRDDVVGIARDIGMDEVDPGIFMFEDYELKELFDKVYAAGVEAEREACAKVCESRRADKEHHPSFIEGWKRTKKHNDELAAMIRARGNDESN